MVSRRSEKIAAFRRVVARDSVGIAMLLQGCSYSVEDYVNDIYVDYPHLFNYDDFTYDDALVIVNRIVAAYKFEDEV